MKTLTFFFATLTTFLTLSMSCRKDPIEKNVIRPLVNLTTEDIPTLSELTQSKFGESPISVSKILNNSYLSCYEFRWESVGEDFTYIDIWVTESKEMAFEVLKEMQKMYTIPANLLEEGKDKPAVVGDLSYFKGIEFIRDNFIIKIHTGGNFDNSITEIAKYVDAKILKSPTFLLLVQVKPVIKDFKISKNPVIEMTQTPLSIEIEDPNNLDIIFQWRSDQVIGYGGVLKDETGTYYYSSTWAETPNIEIGLTLIAINKYGFCADSTIYIETIKQ